MSKVTNMRQMFQETPFNQDIGGWDTSKVTDMYSLFKLNNVFNQDISNWDTSKVTNMKRMFLSATGFDQDLGSWDVTSLTDAEDMFNGVTLSPANYDALLIGWDAQVLKPNVSFHGGNSVYCEATVERQHMIDTDGWTITDG